MLAGGAVRVKPPGGIRPVMLLSNLTGQKTIMWELKVPASNNSTCLCAVGAFEWWSCWRGFAGTPSHHRAWQENRLHSCSKISRSYGSLKLQRRKTSCATNNNHRMVEYSRVTRRKKWRQITDAHNVLTLLFQPCVDGNGESPVWSRPGVWKAEAFTVEGVCWGLKFMNTGKNSPQFLQTWKMLEEQSHETIA